MGKTPVRMKAVVYALSPFQQKVMTGLWKDLPGKIHHKVSENWISATLLLSPLIGTYTYVQYYQEKEKLEHRVYQSMAKDDVTNNYEEVRKRQLLDNKKRFEDLGILKISKSLSDLTNSKKKTQQPHTKQKSRNVYLLEPRRSSRARNPVPSYREEINIDLPPLRKRSKSNSSWASYLARPVDEVKTASYEERAHAIKCAEEVESNLQSKNPSFIKSMVRSHVYSCFWLGLPSKFCEDHLSNSTVDMVLENENGEEYEATFIGKRTGLSGGWRAFALDHKLDDGDALVFELIEPLRFKVYIVRASDCLEKEDANVEEDTDSDAKKASNGVVKLSKKNDAKPKRSTRSKKIEDSSQAKARKRNG